MWLSHLKLAVIAACLLFPTFAAAQASAESTLCPAYSAARVSITLSTELVSTVVGVPVGIHTILENISDEDLKDGALYARVRDGSKNTVSVIDEFVAAREVELAPRETKELDFVWQIPVGVTEGEYRLEVYFVYPRSLFLPPPSASSNDAAALTMHVGSDIRQVIRIDVDEILVEGAEYAQEIGAYTYANNAPITVRVPLKNRLNEPYKGTIKWRLYERGKGPLTEPVGGYTEEIKMHPKGTTELSYIIADASAGSYYLEAELSDGISKSLIAIPFLREGVCASESSAYTTSGNGREINLSWLVASALVVLAVAYAILRGWRVEKI